MKSGSNSVMGKKMLTTAVARESDNRSIGHARAGFFIRGFFRGPQESRSKVRGTIKYVRSSFAVHFTRCNRY